LLSQIAEVEVSRRRLLVAADQERGRLATQLRHGPAAELTRVLEEIESVRRGSAAPPTLAHVERARWRLSEALQELDELASGLHPRAVTEAGLLGALMELAERGSVPIQIDVAATHLPEELEVAIYFICSEGVANIAKHAQATCASIAVTDSSSGLEIVLKDDGRGGADLTAGSGLAGLRDRVETLGGVFEVDSSAELGTRLRVVIPRRDIEAERELTGRERARA
jgi:signal transduction histidine kinase